MEWKEPGCKHSQSDAFEEPCGSERHPCREDACCPNKQYYCDNGAYNLPRECHVNSSTRFIRNTCPGRRQVSHLPFKQALAGSIPVRGTSRGELWPVTAWQWLGKVGCGVAWFMPTKATGAPPDSQSGDSGFDSRRRHSNRGKSLAWLGGVRFGPVGHDKAKQHVGVPHAGRGSAFQAGFRGFDSPHPLQCRARSGHGPAWSGVAWHNAVWQVRAS